MNFLSIMVLGVSVCLSNVQGLKQNQRIERLFNAKVTNQEVNELYNELFHNETNLYSNSYLNVYFSNLKEYFPLNSHGTCAYTALSMVLSYYDNYWYEGFVEDKYDMTTFFVLAEGQTIDVPKKGTKSPGVDSELESEVIDLSYSEYENFVEQNKNKYFQSYLISLNKELYGFRGFENDYSNNPYGMSTRDVYNLLDSYLSSLKDKNNNCIAFPRYVDNHNGQKVIKNFIINSIRNGNPVIVNGDSSIFGCHSMVAYDYDAENDDIYVHTGWKKKDERLRVNTALTRVSLKDLGIDYSQIEGAVAIELNSLTRPEKYNDGNYLSNNGFCDAERYAYPTNVAIENLNCDDVAPTIKFDSLYEERWFRVFNPYISIEIYKDETEEIVFKDKVQTGNEYIFDLADWQRAMAKFRFNTEFTLRLRLLSDCLIFDNFNENVLDIEANAIKNNYYYKKFAVPECALNARYIFGTECGLSTSSYSSSEYDKTVFKDRITEDGLEFKTKSYRAKSDTDGSIILSSYKMNVTEAYVDFQFCKPIDILSFKASFFGNETTEKGSNIDAKVQVLCNQQYMDVLDLIDCDVGLDYNKIFNDYTIVFDNPTCRVRFYTSNINNPNTANDKGRVVFKDIYVYENTEGYLPTNGYELPIAQSIPNSFCACYNYALDYFGCYLYVGQSIFGDVETMENINTVVSFEKYWGVKDPIVNDEVKQRIVDYFKKDSQNLEVQGDDSNSLKGFTLKDKINGKEIDDYTVCPEGTYKIALYIGSDGNELDFHWARQSSDGSWSHKLGGGDYLTVLSWDSEGKEIVNPRTANMNYGYNYQFVSYFAISPFRNSREGEKWATNNVGLAIVPKIEIPIIKPILHI